MRRPATLDTDVRALLVLLAEALDLPHAATFEGIGARERILVDRAAHVVLALRGILGGSPGPHLGLVWETDYLRGQLADCKGAGYPHFTPNGKDIGDARQAPADEFTQPDAPRWVYRAERTTGSGRSMFSYGTRTHGAGAAAVLAAEVAARVRVEHSYTGLLTVWVWAAREDEHYRLPVPAHAERFVYVSGEPDAGGAR